MREFYLLAILIYLFIYLSFFSTWYVSLLMLLLYIMIFHEVCSRSHGKNWLHNLIGSRGYGLWKEE